MGSLAPPPPPRSFRERRRLPSRRVVVAVAAAVVVVAGLLAWQPWQGAGRKQWSAAPPVPERPTAEERAWLTRVAGWTGFVRDAREDPTSLTITGCDERLARLGDPSQRLRDVHELARDLCAVATAQAKDRVGSQTSWDPARAGRANDEEAEADRDLALLVRALGLRAPPGGRVVPFYSQVASAVAGRDVTVRCWESADNWDAVTRSFARTEPTLTNLSGFAVQSQSRVELSPKTCRELASIRAGHVTLAADALEVLAHEAVHLKGPDGIDDEAQTDCYAVQLLPEVAAPFGVSRSAARRIGLMHLRVIQPLMPAQYRSPECRNGGRFDLRRADARFP